MLTLDIDAGNTRVKWRLLDNGVMVSSHAQLNTVQQTHELIDAIAKSLPGKLSRCRLSCVRAPDQVQELVTEIESSLSVAVELPDARSGVGGVVIEGLNPKRLGDDRWLAVLAARKLFPDSPILVVDCGTALTLDAVSRDGVFMGGFIVPGLRVMLESMCAAADRLTLPANLSFERSFAKHSIQCMQNGVATMALSLIEKEYEKQGHRARVVLTGGDAPILENLIEIPVHYDPDLVMNGLEVALP